MTRKQAISLIVDYILTQPSPPKEVCKAVNKLKEIQSDIPFTGWDEKTIRDTLDQFVVDNGRQPTATDLKKKGMPPHPVIKLRFGVSASEWLQVNYPREEVNWRWDCIKKYGEKSSADWKQIYKSEYERINPTSALDYNSRRTPATPSWQVIANFVGATTWTDLKSQCGIKDVFQRKGEITLIANVHVQVMGKRMSVK